MFMESTEWHGICQCPAGRSCSGSLLAQKVPGVPLPRTGRWASLSWPPLRQPWTLLSSAPYLVPLRCCSRRIWPSSRACSAGVPIGEGWWPCWCRLWLRTGGGERASGAGVSPGQRPLSYTESRWYSPRCRLAPVSLRRPLHTKLLLGPGSGHHDRDALRAPREGAGARRRASHVRDRRRCRARLPRPAPSS